VSDLAAWSSAPAAPTLATLFVGDGSTNNTKQFVEEQAPAERIKVVEEVVGKGALVLQFEVREGDPEIAAGHRSELVSGKTFRHGDHLFFGFGVKREEGDNVAGHWQMFFQLHDQSGSSPPLCLQYFKTGGKVWAWLGSGDGTKEYWEGEVGEEGKAWVDLLIRLKLGTTDGEIEVWRDKVLQKLIGGGTVKRGLNTEGVAPIYDKIGIYRTGASVGTTKTRIRNYFIAKVLP
jgi:hypothetical protein